MAPAQETRKGSGAFRRRIIAVPGADHVRAGIEDDIHHFEMTLHHDAARITRVEAETIRMPWTTCPGAIGQLRELVGATLDPAIRRHASPDPRNQCTHMYETALIAIAQAARGEFVQYDVTVPDRRIESSGPAPALADFGAHGRTHATLHRNGELVLAWSIHGETITGPRPFGGMPLRDLGRWAHENLDGIALEQALILRRGIHISLTRHTGDQVRPLPMDTPQMRGACHVYHPDRAALARHSADARKLDFSTRPDALLARLAPIGTDDDFHTRRNQLSGGEPPDFRAGDHRPGKPTSTWQDD